MSSCPKDCNSGCTTFLQGNGWQITLNDRALKTPARQPLIVPSYPLALGIAAEWEWQVCSYVWQVLVDHSYA